MAFGTGPLLLLYRNRWLWRFDRALLQRPLTPRFPQSRHSVRTASGTASAHTAAPLDRVYWVSALRALICIGWAGHDLLAVSHYFFVSSSSSIAPYSEPPLTAANKPPHLFILPITSLCCALSCSASLSGLILLKSPTTSLALPK